MKSLAEFYLVKGDVVKLLVGSPTGYVRFLPMFLSNGNDGHVLKNEKTVRLARPAWGIIQPIIKNSEEWQAKVLAIKIEYKKTKDNRRRVIIFLTDFQRIEKTVKRIMDDKIGYKEVWSGQRLLFKQRVALHLRKEEFLCGEEVIVTHNYYELNKGLFGKNMATIPKKDFVAQLRRAHIDPVRYLKKMSKWNKQLA